MLHLKHGGGGADPGDAAVLQFVGLGQFARLHLPDPGHRPDELGLSAAYDDASGCITVSFCGVAASASPAELAGALGLPMGPVGLPAGWDRAMFCTAEAIGAVKEFVCDRVLLGWGGSGVAVSVEVAAALRLVEEGRAYDVDWGGLVWAVVKREVEVGTPWRYAPYLLRLIVCQGEEDASLGFLGTQNIGDLEEMSFFGSQTMPHFHVMNRIQGCVSDMNNKYLEKEHTCRDTQREVECMKNMVMEKDKQIVAIAKGIQQELLARRVVVQKFEADKYQLGRSIQQYDKLLKKCVSKFQEYMNMVTRGEDIDSYLEDLGITGGLNVTWMRQTCDSKFSKLLKGFTKMESSIVEVESSIAILNDEVERLKNCRSIPDLNNGVEDDGEGKASLATTLGASWKGEGDPVSNTTQGGKQLVELIGNPDERSDTRESMDLFWN